MSRPLGRSLAAAAASLLAVAAHSARAQTVPASAPAPAQADPPALDPGAPLADLPGIGVDWPDLTAEPGTPDEDTQASAIAERRYRWDIEGLADAGSPLLRQRFDQVSALNANDGDPANAAQLDRRAREDAELLRSLLRAEGYYDAQVATRIEAGDVPRVVLQASPGQLYRFAGVELKGIEQAGDKAPALQQAFGLAPGDPVNADRVVEGEAALKTAVGREGFPFASVGQPEVVVDRAAGTATVQVAVAPGELRRFGRVVAAPGNRVFGPDHVEEIARFRLGDPFDAGAIDDLRRALVQTGLVSTVELTPVPGATPETVDVQVKLDPAPPRTIAGELGYETGVGLRAEVSWTHRNLFPPEGALTARAVIGAQEQVGAVVFRRSNAGGRDRVLTVQTAAARLRRPAFDASTFSLSAALERQSTIFFQKPWTWSVGGELVASDERDVIAATGQPRRRTFLIAAAPANLLYDGSDDLLNPTAGFRLGGRLSPELSLQGSAFGYTRVQLDGSAYRRVGEGVVLAGRARLGTIAGAPRDQVAPSRRFYAGGGASVRGYTFQAIGPRDPNNDPIGGRSLTEFSIEARVRAFGSFGVVPFLDAGNIYTSPLPKFSGLQWGAGLGVRYYSSFGPIRVDVGTPLNPRPGDSRLAVYVSLGQAF
jgi:translocation and assembly module TamA